MSVNARYAYVTLAIVGVVALLAVWLILGITGSFPSFGDRNRAGAAIDDPIQHDVQEGKAVSVTHQGLDYEVFATAAVAPDHTGKASAFLVVNGEWTGRLYVGNARGLSGSAAVQVIDVKDDLITFLIWRPGVPIPGQVSAPSGAISDALLSGEARTYTFLELGDVRVILTDAVTELAGNPLTAEFTLNGVSVRPLLVGQTGAASQAAITLRDVAVRHDGKILATFYLTPVATQQNVCGEIDEQTPACMGGSACCGGTCQELPTCGRRLDGPVDSCLDRQLYCCNGALSFIACGVQPGPACGNGVCEAGEATQCPVVGDGPCTLGTCPQDCETAPPAPESCVTTSDCSAYACVQAPCPTNVCIGETCQLRYLLDRGGKSCTTADDCPAFACVTQPCDIPLCEQGHCVLASTTPPSGGGSAS